MMNKQERLSKKLRLNALTVYLTLFDRLTKIINHSFYTDCKTIIKVDKVFISVKKKIIHSNLNSLTSFTFHLTFDKQLSKIQKVVSQIENFGFGRIRILF